MIHILICDDDPIFATLLSQKLMQLPTFNSKGMDVRCVTATGDVMQEDFLGIDILFLDIDMGAINGIDVARHMRQTHKDIILIFVTNFKEYAPDGYEVNAFRYLAKQELDSKLSDYFTQALSVYQVKQQKVEIFCGGEPVPVPLQSLVYIESLGHEQCLHLLNGPRDKLSTRTTLNELEKMLAPHGFLRIHKGYLVNMAYIQTLQSTGARLNTGESIPVGAHRYREIKQRYLTWKGQQAWCIY